MWILTSKKTGIIYYLLPEKPKYTVGRSNTDLILKDDSSISRSHACIFPSDNHVKIIDTGSKYGTYFNENIENSVKMNENQSVELKNGERVQFGVLGNEWTLSKLNICTLVSSLSVEQRIETKQNLDALGGKMTETWIDSCTHLTMSEITVTLKVLRALVENIPIVSSEYWKVYLKNLQDGNKSPPKCEEYLPKLAESFLNKEIVSFGLNDSRRTIFQGKIFIFMDKKLSDKYDSIITCAGGKCKNLNKAIPKTLLVKKDVIVIQHVSQSQSQCSQAINTIEEYIKSKGRRLIPDFEIGLAIIHCSTEKYCNPDHDITSAFLPHSSSLSSDKNSIGNVILAEETPLNKLENIIQDNAPGSVVTSVEIPESVVYSLSEKPEKSESYDADQNLDSEKFKNIDIEIQEVQQIEQRNEFIEKLPAALRQDNVEDFSKNTKRKRSSSKEPDAMRNIKKANLTKENSSSKQQHEENAVMSSQTSSQRFRIDDFLDKSKIKRTNNQNGDNNIERGSECSINQQTANPRKRGKLAYIRYDDDLFKFGTSAKRPKQATSNNPQSHDNNADEEDDALFHFEKRLNNEQRLQSSSSSMTHVRNKNQPLPKQNVSLKSSDTSNVQRVIEPIVIDSSGWLSKSMSKMKIKLEKIKDDSDDIKEDKDWINSIRGGFEVRVKTMQLVSRSFQRDDTSESSVNVDNDNSSKTVNKTRKNFKAFVKACNYKPQKEIIPTVSFRVTCT